ncbi:glycoside hydrolase family 20 [Puteibacter caeruleilacunae]|nr:glycoside hydrolase family 20 [Puteibacter caeruleilacunae]
MKFLIFVLVASIVSSCNTRECPPQKIELIPYPNSLVIGDGCVDLSQGFKIAGETKYADYLREEMAKAGVTGEKRATVEFVKLSNANELGEEGYTLVAKKRTITISANGEKGFFYGIQTLLQLVNQQSIAAVEISDKPAFGWRAYMLDEARYFQGKETVKLLLDEMARLKMNVFHWHLTDDAGWRIEIKKYPKLTEIGSKRDSTQINFEGKRWGSKVYDGKPHSGFYTQEEIKELVAYAADRNITIVPEIGMPGHSSAAIASYSYLGTNKKEIKMPCKFGVGEDVLDPVSEKTIEFLHDVLTEVSALFPSQTIHVGGDEVKYDHWKKSAAVKKYMKENKLETFSDVQVQFTNGMSNFIEQKLGKRMMGWNEILGSSLHGWNKDEANAKTKLSNKAVIHFWKGSYDNLKQAIDRGHQLVNSNHSNTYLDYTYHNISLKKAYGFNPVPDKLTADEAKLILGLGCQMWGEWTPDAKTVEYQTFPRIAAYAEVGWTAKENKNYVRFETALEALKARWTKMGITLPTPEEYNPVKKK